MEIKFSFIEKKTFDDVCRWKERNKTYAFITKDSINC